MKSKTQRLLSWSVFRMTIAAEMWASVLLPAWVEPVQSKKHLKTQSSGFVLTCKKPCQSRVGVENAHHPNSYCTQIVAIAQVGDPRSIPKPWPTEPTEDWQNAEKQHVKKKSKPDKPPWFFGHRNIWDHLSSRSSNNPKKIYKLVSGFTVLNSSYMHLFSMI